MVKKSLLTLLCMAILAALNGCARDDDFSVIDDGGAGKGVGYIAFSINVVGAPATRAFGSSFESGKAYEYALCSDGGVHRAFFFNEDDSYFGSSVVANSWDEDKPNHLPHDSYPEQIHYAYAVGNANSEDALPAKVLLVLNGNPHSLEQLDKELRVNKGDVINHALQWISDQENVKNAGLYGNYFTMSNTTFVDENKAVQTVTAIEGNHVKPTLQEAKNNPVTVFVERVAAKFTVLYNGNDITGQTITPPKVKGWDDDGHEVETDAVLPVIEKVDDEMMRLIPTNRTWKVKVENWGLNGLEHKTNLFKNLKKTDGYEANWDMSAWNAPQYHRSYWAIDQHYDGEDDYYPGQYREGLDVDKPAMNKNTSLHYISYNDIAKGTYTYSKDGNGYSLENTFAYEEALVGYAPLRYGTHIIVAAKLEIDGLDEKDWYRAYNVFWKDPVNYMKYAYGKMCSSFANGREHKTIYLWNDKSQTISFEKAYDKTLYTQEVTGGGMMEIGFDDVWKYFKLSKAYLKGGDGMCLMEPLSETPIYYKSQMESADADAEYTPLSKDEMLSLIYAYTEPVEHFCDRKMYYAIPINHRNTEQKLTNQKIADGEGEEYEVIYQVGDFGVVRNHWYRTVVKAIGTVGTSVDDPDQPIVPNEPDVDYNVSVEIKILPWRVVSDGNDDLRY